MSTDPVARKLEAARKDLLDLGLRNTLINFRHLKSKGVEVVDELSREVFRILSMEGKAMSFLPAPERGLAREEASEDRPELANLFAEVSQEPSESVAARHTDTRLQTLYTPERLQRRLLNTYYAARTAIEEQGVNILYLALGMLHWYESPSSETERLAPLILLPVSIGRADVRSRFRIESTGDDLDTNLSLQLKLAHEFGKELPSISDFDDPLNVGAYYDAVSTSVRRETRWRVEPDEIALGFFSFSKLLMYRDLDEANWPERSKPSLHPVIRSLLDEGFNPNGPGIDVDRSLDEQVDLEDVYHVADADSSQTEALLEVQAGHELVVQGPPGTGKSQTITNIVAEAIAAGRKVLFVSEKMAALDVVRRRLEEAGLGDACVEIHSHRTNKKSFLTELERTLGLRQGQRSGADRSVEELRRDRDRLNRYAIAVNEPIDPSAVTPHEAYGRLLVIGERLEGLTLPELDSDLVLGFNDSEYDARRARLEELRALLGRVGLPSRHPFWGSERRTFMPMTDQPRVEQACDEGRGHLELLSRQAQALSGAMGMPSPGILGDVEKLDIVAEAALQAPDLRGADVRSGDWVAQAEHLTRALSNGQAARELRDRWKKRFLAQAWDVDVMSARRDLAEYGEKWWRWLAAPYREARRAVRGLYQGEAPKEAAALLEGADAVLEWQRRSRHLEEVAPILAGLFGARFNGWRSDWGDLMRIAEHLRRLHQDVEEGHLPGELIEFLASEWDGEQLSRQRRDTVETAEAFATSLDRAFELVELNETVRFPARSREDVPLSEYGSLLSTWRDRAAELQDMVNWNHLAGELARDGLERAVEIAASWSPASDHIVDLVDRARYGGLVEEALEERPSLASFDGQRHAEIVRRFRRLDKELLEANRRYLKALHRHRLPSGGGAGQLGTLLHEFQKKRRHLPIRKLMGRAGHAVQAIKPVFMMSPLSVAAYLPPGTVEFDLVVFDEASQVRPVDALGAILRGRQPVVVGDSRQLPPTSFFDKISDGDEDETDEAAAADLESVLGLFCAQGARDRMLRWHYRSRHESLIAVSNHEFYDDKLFVFPSPDTTREAIGLSFHHLPDAHWERGKGFNRGEAKRVARAVMDHARRRPHKTLGVASFSMSQMQTIQDELEILRSKDPACESFFATHPEEPFFVKNLENVQGDERDVIFISVGYGRTAEGYLSMNFGPLNKDGGERRLNVLITRARERCEVFSSMVADDIDLARSQARGVAAFKTFLQYAQTGILDVPTPTGGEPDSPFEAAVARSLRRHGFEVHHQIGSKGFFVDLAIVDPARPGRYAVGIECDGATYHSARWARDRDRLRQAVLESLGWSIHRIWSTDWFRNPEREIRRVVESFERAKARGATAPGQEPVPEPPPVSPRPDPAGTASGGDNAGNGVSAPVNDGSQEDEASLEDAPAGGVQGVPYELAELTVELGGRELHEVPTGRLGSWVAQVVAVESPVHLLEAASRVASSVGVARVGRRIRSAFKRAAKYAERNGAVKRRGDFLWLPDMDRPTPRDRSDLPYASRKIEMVAPEEVQEAVMRVVEESLGIEPSDAAVEACRVLGYARVTGNLREAAEAAIRDLLFTERLQLNGRFILLGDGDASRAPD